MDTSPLPVSADNDNDPDEHWLAMLAEIAQQSHSLHPNESRDYSATTTHFKPIVSSIYPLFLLQYGLLMVGGAMSNVLIAWHILKQRLYKDVTHALVLNLVLSHCVQCCVVVPMTLTVLLVQNWVLGCFLCYFLPMLQVREIKGLELIHY